MYTLVMIVHVIACLILILVILLQAGRGGGLSGMVGSGQPQSILGTQTNAFMTRATEVCAVIFILTSLTLGIMSTHRGKSLMERQNLARVMQTQAPAVKMPTEEAKKADAVQPATAAAPVAEAKTPVEGNAK